MMRIILMTLLSLSFILSINAQEKSREDRKKQMLEAKKIAYITEELELTPEEATRFWPVYNQWQDKRELEVMKRKERVERMESMSESEADAEINRLLEKKERDLANYREMILDLKKVIPAKKVLKLQMAESRFKKRLLGELGKRRNKARKRGMKEKLKEEK